MLTYVASKLAFGIIYLMVCRFLTLYATTPIQIILSHEMTDCATYEFFCRNVMTAKIATAERNTIKNNKIWMKPLEQHNFIYWASSHHKDSIVISHEYFIRVFSKERFTGYLKTVSIIVLHQEVKRWYESISHRGQDLTLCPILNLKRAIITQFLEFVKRGNKVHSVSALVMNLKSYVKIHDRVSIGDNFVYCSQAIHNRIEAFKHDK